jgi:hypothetical protein
LSNWNWEIKAFFENFTETLIWANLDDLFLSFTKYGRIIPFLEILLKYDFLLNELKLFWVLLNFGELCLIWGFYCKFFFLGIFLLLFFCESCNKVQFSPTKWIFMQFSPTFWIFSLTLLVQQNAFLVRKNAKNATKYNLVRKNAI